MNSQALARNLRWLFWFRMLDRSNIVAPYMLLVYLQLYHLPSLQALSLFSLNVAVMVIFQVPLGMVADRLGRRLCLLIGNSLRVVGFTAYAVSDTITPSVLVFTLLGCVGTASTDGADTALMYDSYIAMGKTNEYQGYELKLSRSLGLVQAASFGAGAGLLMLAGLRSLLWAQAVTYGLTLICALVVREVHVAHPVERRNAVVELGRLFVGLKRRRRLLAVIVYAAAMPALLLMCRLIPLYYSEIRIQDMALPLAGFGLLSALYAASQHLSGLSFNLLLRRFGRHGLMLLLLLIGVVVCAVLSLWVWLGGLVLIFALYFALTLDGPLVHPYINELTESHERATILSIESIVMVAVYGPASALVGAAVDAHGLSTGILVSTSVCGFIAAMALGMLAWMSRHKPLGSAPTEA